MRRKHTSTFGFMMKLNPMILSLTVSIYALMTKDPRHRDEEVLPTCDAEMTSCHGVTSWCQASSPD